MARGYPDFYGYSVVPKYGIPTVESYSAAVPSVAVDVNMISISGKGRSYAGYALFYGTGSVHSLCTVRFVLDGIPFTWISAATELIWNRHADFNNMLSLCQVETTDTVERFALVVDPDWTWGQSCVIQIRNTSGANVQAVVEFYWARVL